MKTDYPVTGTGKRSKVLIKSALLSLFLSVSAATSFAQVANYGFSQSQETYTPLSNAVIIGTPTAQTSTGSIDDQVYPLEEGSIPFPFTFNNTAYTGLQIFANGYITFGTLLSSTSTPISESTAYEGVVAAFAADLHALYQHQGLTGTISYKVIGSAPNREFVIQWAHFKPYSFTTLTTDYWDLNFQIHLKENNSISIAYGVNVTGVPTSVLPQVGLRGGSNSDYNNRLSTGVTASNWSNSTAGSSNSSKMTANSGFSPASGLTFTWQVPSPCVAPIAQPTALNLTYSGSTVNGTFTGSGADSYIVVRTADGNTAEAPENGITYSTGSGLGGTIVAITGTPSFSSSSLFGNTPYTYTVFALNRICANGPLYNSNAPLTAGITTCPSAPTNVSAGSPTLTSFELNWTASAGGENIAFNYSVDISTTADFSSPITGSPFSVSSDETNLFVENLNNATKYYYRIAGVNDCKGTYSTAGSINTLCEAITALPYTEGFNESFLPACWSTQLINGTTNWTTGTSNDGVPSPKAGTRFASKPYANSVALFISPGFDMSAQTADIRFKVWIYRNANSGAASDVIKFHVNSEPAITGATEVLSVGLRTTQAPVVSASGWYEYSAIIPASFTSQTFYIIAQGSTSAGSSSYGLGFDEFSLEAAPVDTIPASVQVTTQNSAAAAISINEGTLQLIAGVTPATASQGVSWSLTNGTGTATISTNGMVTAITDGTVTAIATSTENSSIIGELVITLSNQFAVATVTVTPLDAAPAAITVNAGTLQLVSAILPSGANQSVTWSIANGTGQATISATGLVQGIVNGEVIAKAVSISNPAISGTLTIAITNQLVLFCTPEFGEDAVEEITLVAFGGFSNPSSASNEIPYEDFTAITGTVEQGATATIVVKGNTHGTFTNYFTAYFDWNNNRVFEDSEKTNLGSIVSSTGVDNVSLTANITVPATAALGNIRMRVLKRYSSSQISISACNVGGYGQAEDYTINVTEAGLETGDFEKARFTVYPNPTSGKVTIDSPSEISSVTVYNQLGQLLSSTANKQVNLSGQPAGIYIIRIDFTDGQTATSKIIKQ